MMRIHIPVGGFMSSLADSRELRLMWTSLMPDVPESRFKTFSMMVQVLTHD